MDGLVEATHSFRSDRMDNTERKCPFLPNGRISRRHPLFPIGQHRGKRPFLPNRRIGQSHPSFPIGQNGLYRRKVSFPSQRTHWLKLTKGQTGMSPKVSVLSV